MRMVKTTEIPNDKIPDKSTVIINNDSVEIYLFADGFNQNNQQVGYIKIDNVFIRDKRIRN